MTCFWFVIWLALSERENSPSVCYMYCTVLGLRPVQDIFSLSANFKLQPIQYSILHVQSVIGGCSIRLTANTIIAQVRTVAVEVYDEPLLSDDSFDSYKRLTYIHGICSEIQISSTLAKHVVKSKDFNTSCKSHIESSDSESTMMNCRCLTHRIAFPLVTHVHKVLRKVPVEQEHCG